MRTPRRVGRRGSARARRPGRRRRIRSKRAGRRRPCGRSSAASSSRRELRGHERGVRAACRRSSASGMPRRTRPGRSARRSSTTGSRARDDRADEHLRARDVVRGQGEQPPPGPPSAASVAAALARSASAAEQHALRGIRRPARLDHQGDAVVDDPCRLPAGRTRSTSATGHTAGPPSSAARSACVTPATSAADTCTSGFIDGLASCGLSSATGTGPQSGSRFSRNASRPSTASSVPYARRVASPANTCWPTMPSSTALNANFSMRIAVGDLVRIVRAIASASRSRSACGTTGSRRPSRRRAAREYSSARKNTSRANFCPIWRAK